MAGGEMSTLTATQRDHPGYSTRTRGRDTPSVCAFRAACILGLIIACGFGASLALLLKYRTSSKDKNLNTLQGSIIDPVSIRWVVAMSVTGGGLAVLVILAIWLKLSYLQFEKKRKKKLAQFYPGGKVSKENMSDDPNGYDQGYGATPSYSQDHAYPEQG